MEKKWEDIFNYLSHGTYPPEMKRGQRQSLRKYSAKFSVEGEILYFGHVIRRRVIKTKDEAKSIFEEFHTSPTGGHTGILKTRTALCSRFYWYGMTADIKKWVSGCDRCQKYEQALGTVEKTDCPKASGVWDVVVIDFTGPLPKTSSGFQYILTATDCFSKWVEAFPQSSESAAEVSKNLCTLIYRYGCPRCILSRKKQDFVNEVNMKLVQMLSIGETTIVAHHVQPNVFVEKINDKMKSAFEKLVNEQQENWDQHLDERLFTLRSTTQTINQYSPFFLMYGRDARFFF